MRLSVGWTAIEPGEIDTLSIDFTKEVGAAAPVSTAWFCTVSPDSLVPDPTPANVLNGGAQLQGNISKQSVRGQVDGCTYILEAQLTLNDGRVLKNWATLPCLSASRDLLGSGL